MFSLAVLSLDSGQMDTIGDVDYTYVFVRDFKSDHPLQRFNRSIVLRDGYEFSIRAGQAGHGIGTDSAKVCYSS